ncbi:hypothetical protein ACQ4PT_024012 [Festuca glaucescens]
MESSSNIPGSSPGDNDHHMSVEETEAVTALNETARQRARLAGTNTRLQNRVPPTFIKYDPSLHSTALDSLTSRLVSLSETPLDPLVPPKFKSRRLPRPGRSSPPTPVMSSPPRPPSRKDQVDWKVPPCISRWKNPRGYTIPLDKRQRASEDGEELRNRFSNNFSMLMESLRGAEVKPREAVRMRFAEQMEMRAKLVERREQELRQLAASARAERAAKAVAPAAPPVSVTEDTDDEKPKSKHGDSDICCAHADEQLEKVTKKTDEGLSAGTPARAAGKRERPVELDEPEESDDPFDLDQFMAKFACFGMDEFDLDELLRSMLHIK